ncbi:MAG: hypothetical protein E6J90_21760 [Deltaproteobacteria bacterium]|nr:MAG: hypothetical protein E6J90_21760 [Deltaproteobacteria bacterium]
MTVELPAEPVPSDAASRFAYDVFVIHADAAADEAFVNGYLLAELGLAPERMLRLQTLELGKVVTEEIERGVRSSRVTIVVLSSARMDDRWAAFGEQLVAYASVAKDVHGVLLPLLLDDCKLTMHVQSLVRLDFRDPTREAWEAEIDRLRAYLDRPAVREADLPCPYPGMRPFTERDAGRFFGRDVELDRIIRRLCRGEREIYIIGASGSGKSSLIAAGLVPRLARGVEGLPSFHVLSFRPGERPLGQLAVALEGDVAAPATAVGALLSRHPPVTALLLVVDQLEELFAAADDGQRRDFLAAIRALRSDPRCVLVFTLRADFYGAFMESPLWTDRAGRLSHIDLGPLGSESLRTIIERPARDLDVYLQPELVSRLLDDAAGEPGMLPLLQQTLFQLWGKRRQRLLALADYHALSDGSRTGLAFAVKEHADDVLGALTEAQKAIAFRILLRLVNFGEGRADTRRQQPREALRSEGEAKADFDAVLQDLVDSRLVTITDDDRRGDVRVDLAHEILIHAWSTFADRIRTSRVREQRRRDLEAAAAAWRARGSGDGGLLDPIELAEVSQQTETARELGESTDVAALIAESMSAHDKQRKRRRRLVWGGFAALTVFAVVVVTFAVMADASRKRAEASNRESRRLLAQSLQEAGWQQLLGGHPQEAMPYLLAAREKGEKGQLLRLLIGTATRFLPVIPILEHRAAVSSAAFSSDGTRIVTASSDHTARVWDAATGKSLVSLLGHQGGVNSAAFSPDGTRVVTASSDHTARIWNAATGKPLVTPLEHQGAVNSAAFSPDGTRVVTASSDHTARIWDAVTGKLLASPLQHQCVVWSATFSPDGTRVVTASWDRTARVWDAATGKPLSAPLEHQDRMIGAAFSPDGTRVVTASWDKTARVWDAATGKPLTAPLEHQGPVRTAAFSPDSTRVVTASSDKTARIWDAATGKPLASFAHPGAVRSAAFSPDGTRVVTASYYKTARVWDAATGRPLAIPLEHQGGVNSAAFSPDGTRVVTASLDNTARVWDAATGKPLVTPLEHQHRVNSAAFSSDGTRVVTASLDATARVWDAATGKPLPSSLQHQRAVLRAAFSSDGTRVVTASDDNTARIWDAATGKPLATLLEHERAVNSAAFSPDGTLVVTASDDNTARIWDAATGKPLASPLEHEGPVWSATFSPDGTRVITASFDNTARIWDAATGKSLVRPLVHQAWVRSATFSPDSTRVVTASFDNTAQIWDAATGKPLGPPLEHQAWVWSAAFSSDGTRVVTASFDNTARVWDAATGKPIATLLEHQEGVNSAAFSPDGTRVVTASDDNTARVWDAATGKPLGPPLQHQAAVHSAVFSPDGTRVVTASDDNTARVWETRLEETAQSDWSVLAARSPFVLSGTGHVRRAAEPVLDLAPRSATRHAPTPEAPCSTTPRNATTAKSIPQPPDRRAEPIPFAPRQIWSGHYFCTQGRTSLALQITSVRDNTGDAVFAFSHAESSASGSYQVSGWYDPTRRRLALLSGAWIRQPPGYRSVDLSGTVSADGSTFAGSITTSGCSTFTVRRR